MASQKVIARAVSNGWVLQCVGIERGQRFRPWGLLGARQDVQNDVITGHARVECLLHSLFHAVLPMIGNGGQDADKTAMSLIVIA